MQKRYFVLAALCLALGLFAKPPMQTKVTLQHEAKQSVSIQYLLYLPEQYDTKKDAKWPLLVFLHGLLQQLRGLLPTNNSLQPSLLC